MNQPRALVIDDEPDICELLTLTLGRMDIETLTAQDVAGAKSLLKAQAFDLCLTDMRLPDGDGLDLVQWMQSNASGVPVAVITAHGNVETAVQALKLGAFDFISKPLDLNNLRNIVGNALKLDKGGKQRIGNRRFHHVKGFDFLFAPWAFFVKRNHRVVGADNRLAAWNGTHLNLRRRRLCCRNCWGRLRQRFTVCVG